MGWFSELFNTTQWKFWYGDIPSSRRAAVRITYLKHRQLVESNSTTVPEGTSAHEAGLYGAFGARLIAHFKQPVIEPFVWMELAPFLLMSEGDALAGLAEYLLYMEVPAEANLLLLEQLVNDAVAQIVHAPENKAALVRAGLKTQRLWCQFIRPEVNSIIAETEAELYEEPEQPSEPEFAGTSDEAQVQATKQPESDPDPSATQGDGSRECDTKVSNTLMQVHCSFCAQSYLTKAVGENVPTLQEGGRPEDYVPVSVGRVASPQSSAPFHRQRDDAPTTRGYGSRAEGRNRPAWEVKDGQTQVSSGELQGSRVLLRGWGEHEPAAQVS